MRDIGVLKSIAGDALPVESIKLAARMTLAPVILFEILLIDQKYYITGISQILNADVYVP